jgi:hypothetical protein
MLSSMTQSDRHIPENARCATCDGVGWTPWAGDGGGSGESKWIVCRECIGTGRKDQKGRKRLKPDNPPGA